MGKHLWETACCRKPAEPDVAWTKVTMSDGTKQPLHVSSTSRYSATAQNFQALSRHFKIRNRQWIPASYGQLQSCAAHLHLSPSASPCHGQISAGSRIHSMRVASVAKSLIAFRRSALSCTSSCTRTRTRGASFARVGYDCCS